MTKRKLEDDRLLHDGGPEAKKPKHSEVNSTANGTTSAIQHDSAILKKQGSAEAELKRARATTKHAKRLARRKRKEHAEAKEAQSGKTKVDGHREAQEQPSSTQGMKGRKKQRRKEDRESHAPKGPAYDGRTRGGLDGVDKHNNSSKWGVSEATGGKMLDIDPIFTPNEEYLLIAYETSVNIYSTTTSLLVRKLRVDHTERVSAFALSATDPSNLYIATQTGIIQTWDWLEGRRVHFWFTRSRIYALATCKLANEGEESELVYTIDRKAVGPWRISAHRPGTSQGTNDSKNVTLRKSQEPITSFKVLEYGRVTIATSGSVLTLGVADHLEQNSLNDLFYTWRDIECPEWISCFDIRTVEANTSSKSNYILSGGLETVLLIWQLETGNRTTLPHLGASLDGIVVSPSGPSYAIRLADNSAMILSTSELKPTFSVAGAQLPADVDLGVQLPLLPNVDTPTRKSLSLRRLHYSVASGPQGLLCAVPPATSSRLQSGLSQRASYLQTLDMASAHQLSRQALTRTKATDLNVGPESNTIEEPNVVLMQVSHDGQWLATVDEWMPPKRNLAILTHDDERGTKELRARKEIYMKFWSWNNDGKVWELVSRIDDPHACETSAMDGENRVLDLAANPTCNSFATVGGDGLVRIWTTMARQRHGSIVKNRHGQRFVNWHCQSIVPIYSEASSPQIYIGAKIAYSTDGSCLAAAYPSSSPWTVHLIDSQSGTVHTGPYGPFAGPLSGLGIIDRYLIILSEQLLVWNLVTQKLAYGCMLSLQHSHISAQDRPNLLAVDDQGGTFAIVLPSVDAASAKAQAKLGSEIMIFEPRGPTPVFVQKIPRSVTVLTKIYNRPGYLVIDSAAEIRILTPRQARLDPSTALPSPPQTPSRGLQAIYGNPRDEDNSHPEAARKQLATSVPTLSIKPRMDENVSNVVPQESLAEIFDVGPAYAMPPVTDLFECVARLFAGKKES
ncbi:MAG: hypothetical protein Q9225_002390 [Loekoesia sp. 1 TL-2023]